jgi:hypothetical protein
MSGVNAPLSATLNDAVAFFEQKGVRYALIGGLAASLRGQPRVTVDVDLVIAADVGRTLALIPSLAGSAFEPLFEGAEEVVERSFMLPLRHRTTGVKVDVAVGLSGFEQQVIRRAEPMSLAGKTVVVATAEDLLIMKTLAGRPHDDQDARGLISARGPSLDWEYCEKTARDLGEALGQDLLLDLQKLRRSVDA